MSDCDMMLKVIGIKQLRNMVKVRAPCYLYTKEPFPRSHAGEHYMRCSSGDLSLSLKSWWAHTSRCILRLAMVNALY